MSDEPKIVIETVSRAVHVIHTSSKRTEDERD